MLLQTVLLSFCLLRPDHPKDLLFPGCVFTPPVAEEYVAFLNNGVPVFISEDNGLPPVRVVAAFHGGTTSVAAEELDEEFAFLAAIVGVRDKRTGVAAGLNCLSFNFDRAFELFLDMLQIPGFQEAELRLEQDSGLNR